MINNVLKLVLVMSMSIVSANAETGTIGGKGAMTAGSADPCDVIMGVGVAKYDNGYCVMNSPKVADTELKKFELSLVLLQAKQVSLLASISNQMKEFKIAVDALNQASANLLASNKTWRNETLTKALDRVDAMPAKLADVDSLKKALAAVLTDQLANDPTFLAKVKSMSQK